jgi:hypothetical protein
VSTFRVVEAGDSVLVVEFEERIDPAVNARVVALAHRLQAEPVAGVRDVVPMRSWPGSNRRLPRRIFLPGPDSRLFAFLSAMEVNSAPTLETWRDSRA